MSIANQRGLKATIVLSCDCCGTDIRIVAESGENPAQMVRMHWKGPKGLFISRWIMICQKCEKEAETGVNEPGWRW